MNPRESAFEMQMCNCRLRLLLHRDLCMCVHVSPSARACVRVCGPSGGCGGGRVGWLFSCGSELTHIPREIHPGCLLNVGHVRLKPNFSVTSPFSPSSSTPSRFFLVGAIGGLNPRALVGSQRRGGEEEGCGSGAGEGLKSIHYISIDSLHFSLCIV